MTPLPPENYVIAIHGERSGEILKRVVVSRATAEQLITWLNTAGTLARAGADVARAGGDLMRAAQGFGEMLDRLSGPKKIPARRRR